jgi:hypothetical protein
MPGASSLVTGASPRFLRTHGSATDSCWYRRARYSKAVLALKGERKPATPAPLPTGRGSGVRPPSTARAGTAPGAQRPTEQQVRHGRVRRPRPRSLFLTLPPSDTHTHAHRKRRSG